MRILRETRNSVFALCVGIACVAMCSLMVSCPNPAQSDGGTAGEVADTGDEDTSLDVTIRGSTNLPTGWEIRAYNPQLGYESPIGSAVIEAATPNSWELTVPQGDPSYSVFFRAGKAGESDVTGFPFDMPWVYSYESSPTIDGVELMADMIVEGIDPAYVSRSIRLQAYRSGEDPLDWSEHPEQDLGATVSSDGSAYFAEMGNWGDPTTDYEFYAKIMTARDWSDQEEEFVLSADGSSATSVMTAATNDGGNVEAVLSADVSALSYAQFLTVEAFDVFEASTGDLSDYSYLHVYVYEQGAVPADPTSTMFPNDYFGSADEPIASTYASLQADDTASFPVGMVFNGNAYWLPEDGASYDMYLVANNEINSVRYIISAQENGGAAAGYTVGDGMPLILDGTTMEYARHTVAP